ncbi:MAG TPA: DNA repair protein RecO [Candidatus Acidoferrum sp.]|nr:DNA repair protein RecO [Candidatus Acidoferrum sp.]
MKNDSLHQCWLLHARAYRESSLLLELFSRDGGRQSAIARGVRTAGKRGTNYKRSLLQPFIPLQLTLAGRGELRTVGQLEAAGPAVPLQGERLLSGLYVNELLVRLLPPHENEQPLFDEYTGLLHALAGEQPLEPLLRTFELLLLDVLGYGLQLDHDADSGESIDGLAWYHLHEGGGFVRHVGTATPDVAANLYRGEELIRIARRDFADEHVRRTAKRLLRLVLQQHLGKRELTSRSLFARPKTSPPQD